jgi:hypothetical protein
VWESKSTRRTSPGRKTFARHFLATEKREKKKIIFVVLTSSNRFLVAVTRLVSPKQRLFKKLLFWTKRHLCFVSFEWRKSDFFRVLVEKKIMTEPLQNLKLWKRKWKLFLTFSSSSSPFMLKQNKLTCLFPLQ